MANRENIGARSGWGSALLVGLIVVLMLTPRVWAQGPSLTTITDTVYRADGTPASGMVLVSWPSFQTAEGDTVAAGNRSATLGEGGSFTIQLAPNVGASPAGTYYVVVFQLSDGTVRSEFWAVPATAVTTISAVRATPGTGLGNLAATQQYVNTAVATRALDAAVVHLTGPETITGSKQFAVSPSLPQPVGSSDAASKGYVDAAVENVGAGSFVSKTGDSMSGPLTLPGPPTAPNHAVIRQYVDSGLTAKADVVNGLVPAGELGTGPASSATCLTGNSTWGSCGSGAPAGITYATTALNWSQTISTSLSGGSPATVTLTPCPVGIDTTSGAGYQVQISGGGNSEAVKIATLPGACTSGAASGTITFTPFYSYPAGSTIGSASSGIQETINAACGVDPVGWKNTLCNVTIPASGPGYPVHSNNTYGVTGTIYFHANQSILSGYGVSLNCTGRGPCLQVGDLLNSNDYSNLTVQGLNFRTPVNYTSNPSYAGVQIVSTSATAGSPGYRTITTASAHGFRVGDMVTILFTDNSTYWGDAIVASVPTSTTFTYNHSGSTITAAASPGVVALAYEAVLDNSQGTHLGDINYDLVGNNGAFNNFFDFWDDEDALIEHFNNNAATLNGNTNWTGSYVFSAGNQGAGQQIAPVITLRDSNITANYSNGVTVYNSNGVYIENTVIQASGPWQVYAANYTGNYQGADIKNMYSESTVCMNPPVSGNGPVTCPNAAARSPFPGLGIAGLIAGTTGLSGNFSVTGSGSMQGAFPTGGTGSTQYSYFIVAKDGTSGTRTWPMQVLNYASTGSDAIPVRWPRVANGTDSISYDVVRIASPIGVGSVYPSSGNCNGGSPTACGSVVLNLTQSAACGNGLTCSYTDSGSVATSSYPVLMGNYNGQVNFWPGSIVSVNKTVHVDNENGNVVAVGLNGNPVQAAVLCNDYGTTSGGGFTDCLFSGNGVANQAATLLTDGGPAGGGMSFSKGRLNFSTSPQASLMPHHIITLIDSNPGLTQGTWGYRPAASGSDTWIGTDVPSSGVGLNNGQLAMGAPRYIDLYINNAGDNTNFLERLGANQKLFNVPVQFNGNVTLSGLANGCLNVASGVIGSTGSPCGSGGGGGSVSSVFGRSGAVVAQSGDYVVSQVTGAAADSSVVHNSGAETIGGSKTFTNTVSVGGNLILPQGSGYVPTAGGLGLDTAAGLPVVNLGGATHQVAFTSSNITGQAGTALALTQTPTQCSGSFATGIQANGNANCTTPNLIQLAEATQPAGIPNWGVFWFDSTTHTPRVIDNNGQPMQLGLANLFNSDPGGNAVDNLEERNGSSPQNMRVYSSYASPTTWTRMSLGYDATSGYQVLRSEDASSGNALGLGMFIGSSLKWAFAANGTLKPNTDGLFDLGSDTGQAVRSVFAKTSFNMYTQGRQDFEFADGGTAVNLLAVYGSGGTTVQTASTSSTDGVVGIVSGYSTSTPAKAVITWAGFAVCNFDAGSPVSGNYAVASATQAGKCHDTGSTARPSGVQVIGRIENGGVRVSLASPSGGVGGGAVASVFGRTGAVTAQSGDYGVAQVTGAAADSAVVHVTGTETIAGSKTFSSDVTMTGNLSVAGTITQTGTSPTVWSGKKWTGTTSTVPTGMDFSLGIGSDGALKCQLSGGSSCMPGGGAVTSVFGRTGAVVAASGDYSVAQITDAAPLASPAFTGTATGVTASAGDNSTKLATTAYVRNESYFSWTCPVAGSTSVSQNCNWTVPAGVTITGFDFAANTAPAGCTTYPVVQVWDGTSGAEVGSYSIPLTAGTNFYSQVVGNANLAAGHLLRVKVTTAAAGCSTNAGGMVATVTYQMQN